MIIPREERSPFIGVRIYETAMTIKGPDSQAHTHVSLPPESTKKLLAFLDQVMETEGKNLDGPQAATPHSDILALVATDIIASKERSAEFILAHGVDALLELIETVENSANR